MLVIIVSLPVKHELNALREIRLMFAFHKINIKSI